NERAQVLERVLVPGPDTQPQQVAVRHHTIGITGQHPQQLIFGRRQVHFSPVASHAAGLEINAQPASANDRLLRPPCLLPAARSASTTCRSSSTTSTDGVASSSGAAAAVIAHHPA